MSGKRTIIAGGTLATAAGTFRADIIIEDGRVAAITDSGAAGGGDELIDAAGLVVMPGAIDMHAHFEDPGHTEREDFTTGTMSAAAGGITTVMEHPLTYPPVTTAQLYREKREMAGEKVVVDFGLWGALTAPSLPEIGAQWQEGAPGFKAFMPVSDPSYPNVTDAEFLEGMRRVKDVGGLVLVHAESDSLLQAGLARMRAEGRRDPLAHHEARPPFVEEEAVHRALFLAAHAGVRIQIVHVSSPVSADLVREEKAAGRPATMEICPHHLLLDLDDLVRLGPYGMCAPALRDRALVERLWDAVLDGTADCLVSDHSAYTLEEKEPGWSDIFAALLGCQVIQETVPLVLDEAFHRRHMPLDAFVRFSSTNAARIAGLYPRKGSLLPGADADIALFDLDGEWVVDARSQQFSKNPWSPFDGRRVGARVVRTLVRGETVYADGEIVAQPGFGRFLSCHDDYSLGPPLRPAVAG
ncbi:MAG TPA: allantoinase AllB [Gaiellales bacterium]|jgi:allantoinase|nr:allantoinase AllB [Gaiellales bacterium]